MNRPACLLALLRASCTFGPTIDDFATKPSTPLLVFSIAAQFRITVCVVCLSIMLSISSNASSLVLKLKQAEIVLSGSKPPTVSTPTLSASSSQILYFLSKEQPSLVLQ